MFFIVQCPVTFLKGAQEIKCTYLLTTPAPKNDMVTLYNRGTLINHELVRIINQLMQ